MSLRPTFAIGTTLEIDGRDSDTSMGMGLNLWPEGLIQYVVCAADMRCGLERERKPDMRSDWRLNHTKKGRPLMILYGRMEKSKEVNTQITS